MASDPRRTLLRALALNPLALGIVACPQGAAAQGSPVRLPPLALPPMLHPGEPLVFPRDHGAHPALRTEWWYVTGSLWPAEARSVAARTRMAASLQAPFGFQITFFRSRVDEAADSPSAFAARQLVFAHAALTDVARGRLLHDQRIGRAGFGVVQAGEGDTQVRLRDWQLQRHPGGTSAATRLGHYHGQIPARGFAFDLKMAPTQPLLLQGESGFSRKGPRIEQASRYYSQPQMAVQGTLRREGQASLAVAGLAWLDHEWSESLLDPEAVGWDWVGMQLTDGGALTAFQLRRRDGSALWAGGSLRRAGQPDRSFGPNEVHFTPLRHWRSPATQARYPVAWRLQAGDLRCIVEARLDAQELDSRGSTGSIYWEGLSLLRDEGGQPLGSGYLEMTGYAGPLKL